MMRLKLSLIIFFLLVLTLLSAQTCGSFFYDSGGPDGQYGNSEFSTWTFCADNPEEIITINFTFVDVETGYDFLRIYDGTGTDAPINTNIQAPETFTSNAADGCLTVRWQSDNTVVRDGWEATIGCIPLSPCPLPTDVQAVDFTRNGCTFFWEQTGDVTEWEMEIVPAGEFPTGVPTIIDITENPFVWTGGESNTGYDAYLRGKCEGGESSYWSIITSFRTAPTCGDTFYDSGGPNGEYSHNEDQIWIICPDTPGEVVTINFTEVDVEFNRDFLNLYDGVGTSQPRRLDIRTPLSFTASSTDGCITLTWESDGGISLNGWEAIIGCLPASPCISPTNITISDISSLGATFSWSQDGEIDTWEIEAVPTGSTPSGNPTITGVTSNPYIWTGADSQTSYDIYIRSQCEDGDAYSYWIGPTSFTTFPGCGDMFFDSGGSEYFYRSDQSETYIFCPDTSGDLISIDFLAINLQRDDSLKVFSGIGTDYLIEPTIDAPGTITSLSEDGCLTLTWRSDDSQQSEGWEAVINCVPATSCVVPYISSITDLSTSEATISWLQAGPVSAWDIEIVIADTPPTGVPSISGISANTYSLDALISGTDYDVYIRGHCDGVESFTPWTSRRFRTIPACGDYFYDSGGPDGDYDFNEDQTWTFCPDTPEGVMILDFTFVDAPLEDQLRVYNGAVPSGPSTLVRDPALLISSADDGCLSAVFQSGTYFNHAGWEAEVKCEPCVPAAYASAEDVEVIVLGADSAVIQVTTPGLDSLFIEYGSAGFEPGTGSTFVANNSTFTIAGLEEDSEYEFYISHFCGEGLITFQLGPIPFTTRARNDIGVTALVNPSIECGLEEGESIVAMITNFGASTQTSFLLNYSVNGVLAGEDDIYTGELVVDEAEEYQFTLLYDFAEIGDYTIQVWTDLEQDNDQTNDTLTITLARFAPPLQEDFENTLLPYYLTTSPGAALYNSVAHESGSRVLADRLRFTYEVLQLDLPAIGPMTTEDVLIFDYRLASFPFGDSPATSLSITDSLSVLVSMDCGQTFELVYSKTGDEHEPSIDFQTISIPLAAYAGDEILIRIQGKGGGGLEYYWLDFDNIFLSRCTGIEVETFIQNAHPGVDNGSISVSPSSGLGPYTYAWSNGETVATIINLSPGDYTVLITDRLGCTEEITLTVDIVDSTHEPEIAFSSIRLAPNPVLDQTNLQVVFKEKVDVQLQLLNPLGSVLWESPLLKNVHAIDERIDFRSIPAGLYLLRIKTAGQDKMIKVIKAE